MPKFMVYIDRVKAANIDGEIIDAADEEDALQKAIDLVGLDCTEEDTCPECAELIDECTCDEEGDDDDDEEGY